MILALAYRAPVQGRRIESLLHRVNLDLAKGDLKDIQSQFVNPEDFSYVPKMKKFRPDLTAEVIPVPPGYHGRGEFWMVFSTWQNIELTADAVYEVHRGDGGFKLGKEVWEDDLGGWRVKSVAYRAVLHPDSKEVDVTASLQLKSGDHRALVFRLNQGIQLKSQPGVTVDVATPEHLVEPKEGDLVRAGGLLIPWTSHPNTKYRFSYTDKPPSGAEDSIAEDHAYVSAWWIPSLGRLPAPVDATVTGPADWHIRCEGDLISKVTSGDTQTVHFKCPLPISFPKIIGGEYQLEASQVVGSDKFNVWQVQPFDKKQADTDLKSMIRSATYYQSILGPLPFHGYSLYDSKTYYGIESYSHTLLQKGVTHFVTHEMGHSYFGGYAPCTYVHDAWNEGLTEFLDSVLLNHDADKTLEHGLDSLNIPVPLNKMRICWDNENAAYMRGAFVMQMLEAVIGEKAVIEGMHLIVTQRVGKDTRWDDLRQYFEKTSGQDLGWFWSQWIDNAIFPTVKIVALQKRQANSGYTSKVSFEQMGTDNPFRLKFELVAESGEEKFTQMIDMTKDVQQFTVDTPFNPSRLTIKILGLSLIHAGHFP